MAGHEIVKIGFDFLRKFASEEGTFTVKEMASKTGWSISSVETYISKQWKGYLNQRGKGSTKSFAVRREFLRVTLEEFISVATQKQLVVPAYQRALYDVVLQFEFLLPLSREEQLRRALDELFFADTLKTRVHEIGLVPLARVIERTKGIDDQAYIQHVISKVSDYFGGYSISHVQGRFRADILTDVVGAAEKMRSRHRYLIDETTAVVRFIAPCTTTKTEFDDDFNSIMKALQEPQENSSATLRAEILLIRAIFFFFFVETVIRTIKGEDEIWLLETGLKRRLYTWTKQA